jgi:hypothetical protein
VATAAIPTPPTSPALPLLLRCVGGERVRESLLETTIHHNRVEDLLVSSLTQELRLSKNKMPLHSLPLSPPPSLQSSRQTCSQEKRSSIGSSPDGSKMNSSAFLNHSISFAGMFPTLNWPRNLSHIKFVAMAFRQNMHVAQAAFVFGLVGFLCVIQTPAAVAFSAGPGAGLSLLTAGYLRAAMTRGRGLVEKKGVEESVKLRGSKRCSVGLLQMCSIDNEDVEPAKESRLWTSTTLFRDRPSEVAQGQHEQIEPRCTDDDEFLMSASRRTLHRDLYSWRDIYEWYTSYHAPLCAGEAGLQLRRDLYEALSVGDLAQAGRIRQAPVPKSPVYI